MNKSAILRQKTQQDNANLRMLSPVPESLLE